MQHKIRFFTKALKFEREFNWPFVGPVTMQQLAVTAVTWVIATLLFLTFMSIKIAPACGFLVAFSIWFLYGAIKPDGKRIHRFCIDVLKYVFRHKSKNKGEHLHSYRVKRREWVRIQE